MLCKARQGQGVKERGDEWVARCPAHDDKNPSLSIGLGEKGGIVLHCHAGCKKDAICKAVGWTLADLMPANDKPKANRKRRIVATYDYRDEHGELLFQVVRYEPKGFSQRRPDGKGGWIYSVKDVRVVPYRLDDITKQSTRPVLIVEGEKDADRIAKEWGSVVTCNAGGAGKWIAEHSKYLAGRGVVILHDNDGRGREHAMQVAASLCGVASSVQIVELPGLPEKGDVSDWIAAGGTKEQFVELVKATPEWTPEAAADQPWPEIESFDATSLPEFPTSALPSPLREWVEAESHATQTPADLAGLLALAVCSAMIARRVVVEPWPGYREPVNLCVAVLLEPGNRKTAVFQDATKPLRGIESENIESARSRIAREQSDRRQAEKRLAKLEKIAAEKGDADARNQAFELAQQLADWPEPAFPRLLADDVTGEKLGMMLAEQDGRMASMSPEGVVFDLMAGLYSKGGIAQFDVYLKGHSGDDLITDRVGRKSVRVQRPALTCGYAIQPEVINGLADKAAFRGRGLLARFLYAVPKSWIGKREIAPEPVSEATKELYAATIRRLAAIPDDTTLGLTSKASEAFIAWLGEIENMLDDGGEMEAIQDWGAKLAGETLRLAAVLHCVEAGPVRSIERSTIDAAVKIARYLIPDAETVLEMMQPDGAKSDGDAQYVLRWIKRLDSREFTKRDAHQHGRRRFPKADDIDPVLQELTRRGYIRPMPAETSGPGRPASPRYEVNPALFEGEGGEGEGDDDKGSCEGGGGNGGRGGDGVTRTQNPQNSADTGGVGNSEDIEDGFQQNENENRVQVTL